MIHHRSSVVQSATLRIAGPAMLLLLSGCAGYRLGNTLPPGIRSVAIPTFVNQTRQPNLEFETTNATIEEFQKDGSLRVVAPENANAMLEVTLTDYRLEPTRYRSDQPLTGREYRLQLTADAVFRRWPGGDTLAQRRKITGDATFFVSSDLPSAEREALRAASQDLARRLVRSVLEYW